MSKTESVLVRNCLIEVSLPKATVPLVGPEGHAPNGAVRTCRVPRPGAQRPWLATAAMASAAASGSRYCPPRSMRPHVRVEPVDQRDAGRDVEPHHGLLRHAVEVLHQRAQRVAVRRHADGLARAQVGHDGVVPVGEHPVHDVGQALGARLDLVGQVGVAGVADLAPLAGVVERRRRGVVGAAPEHELLLAELRQGGLLVLALQRAVVPLVEPPRAPHRDPVPVARVEGEVRRGDRATEHGGVQHVGQHAGLGHQRAAALRLGPALVAQRDVDPAGEEVLGVPLALAVAEQDQGVLSHASSLATWSRDVRSAHSSTTRGPPGVRRRGRPRRRPRRARRPGRRG